MPKQHTKDKRVELIRILGYEVGDKPDIYCIECWDRLDREGRTFSGTVKELLYPQVKVQWIFKKKSYICSTCGRRLYDLKAAA